MRKFLALVFAVVFGYAGVQKLSAATLYGVLSSDKSKLTIYYDDNMSSRGGTTTWRETYAYRSYPTKIAIHSSVKNVKLTSGKDFFK